MRDNISYQNIDDNNWIKKKFKDQGEEHDWEQILQYVISKNTI